jgi:tetraacyldisaccharide 4'-kinase
MFKSEKVGSKVISVGNLTLGGSGKTPAVIAVINILKNAGISVGLLSRGYGRRSKGYLLVSNGKGDIIPVNECSDEMYLVTDECQVPSAVSERRVSGAEKLLNDVPLDVIVLDDAFQHRWIARDLDIVMCDQRFLLKTGKIDQNLLPLGVMREPFSSLKRADIIILNRKFTEKKEIPEKIKKYLQNKKVFNGHYEVSGIYDLKTHQEFDMEEFRGQNSLVVCGIARPYSFLNLVEKSGINIKNKMLFPDHKDYTLKEVQSIRKRFYDTNSFSVLATQKDAVKLTNFARELDDIDIYYLKIELKIDNENLFIKEVLSVTNN